MGILKEGFSALLKNRLRISPKKCLLFRTNLQYMGNATTPFHSKRMQKLCRNGKFFEYVLPRIAESITNYIQLHQKRETIYLRKRTRRLF